MDLPLKMKAVKRNLCQFHLFIVLYGGQVDSKAVKLKQFTAAASEEIFLHFLKCLCSDKRAGQWINDDRHNKQDE